MALYGITDTQLDQPKFINVGQVKTVVITNGGTGYSQGAAVTFSAPPAGGVTATGTINVTGGVITSVTITNPGAGYVTAPTMTAPVGSGLVNTVVIQPVEVANSEIVFVSLEESALASNRAKGLKTPGWNRIWQKMDSDGSVRYRVEPMVSLTALNAAAGDVKGDDANVGDVDITITAQPTNQTVTAPATANFTITATGTGLTYQWQVQTGGVGAYANVASGTGGTTASYTTAATNTGMTGNRYRCLVSNAGATAVITSKGAKLTAN